MYTLLPKNNNRNYQVVTNRMILFFFLSFRWRIKRNLLSMIYLVFVPALSAAFNALFPMINKMCFSQKKMKTIWSFSFKSIVLHNYVLMILDHCVVNDNPLMMFQIENRCCFTYLNRKKKRKEIELVKRTNCWTAWFFVMSWRTIQICMNF